MDVPFRRHARCLRCRRCLYASNRSQVCYLCRDRFRCCVCRTTDAHRDGAGWCPDCSRRYAGWRTIVNTIQRQRPDAQTLAVRLREYGRRAGRTLPLYDPLPNVPLIAAMHSTPAGERATDVRPDRQAPAIPKITDRNNYTQAYARAKALRLVSWEKTYQRSLGND